jgi:hypothetical protein
METNKQLHTALDTLLAQFLIANPDKRPSTTTVLELAAWSHARLTCPATIPGSAPGSHFQCTRMPGHGGRHDAGGGVYFVDAARSVQKGRS